MTTKARVTHMGGNGAVRVRIMSGGTEITRHLLNAEGESHDFFIHGNQNLEVQEGVHIAPTVVVDEGTTEDETDPNEGKGDETEVKAAAVIAEATDSIVASAEAEATQASYAGESGDAPDPAAGSSEDGKQSDTNEA